VSACSGTWKERIILIAIVANIWEKTRTLNYELKNDIYQLNSFEWPVWEKLAPELQWEHLTWFQHVINTDLAPFTADERHEFAVINRMKNDWQLGKKRDDKKKIDPYLKPLKKCGEWFFYWGSVRDTLLISEIKRNWKTCRKLKSK